MSRSKKNFKFVPETTSIWNNIKISDLRNVVFDYFRNNLKGRKVVNDDLGITVWFSMENARKSAKGGSMYHKKAEIVKILPEIIKYALYNNFGERKDSDNPNVIGFFNFKGKCILDGETEHLRLAVQLQKTAKFYYNIEVNRIIIKSPVPKRP